MKTKLLVGAVFCIFLGPLSSSAQSNTNLSSEVHALGLEGVQADIAARHIQISQRISAVRQASQTDIPVHIVYRHDTSDTWHLVGTGTIFPSWSNSMTTAYHVFSGAPGQYGCRRIGAQELEGKEPVIAIVGYDHLTNDVDDVITVRLGTGENFPEILVPESDNIFKGFGKGDLVIRPYSSTIHPLTYPGQTRQTVFWIEIRPSVAYVFFSDQVQPGESGTSSHVDGMSKDCRLITLRSVQIDNQDLARSLGTTNNACYGIGYMVNIK